MPSSDEEWPFATRQLGRWVRAYDAIPSTNDAAAELANQPEHHGTILLAHHQTAGRGQYGRLWLDQPGQAVLLSMVLFPPETFRHPVALTAWAAVSVARTVDEFTGRRAAIKWPNDILVVGRKVCGILIEQRTGIVVGLGLNVSQPPSSFESVGLTGGTSLAMIAGRSLTPAEVLPRLVHHLDQGYMEGVSESPQGLEREWVDRLELRDQVVQVQCHSGERILGRVRELTFQSVVLVSAGAQERRLAPESIRQMQRQE